MPKPEKLDNVHTRIYRIRGKQMMLDSDLADLYDVKTFNLNKAVRRNIKRFPPDFMCQLSNVEHQNLIFQIGISSSSWGGRRHRPYALEGKLYVHEVDIRFLTQDVEKLKKRFDPEGPIAPVIL
jgi:hypothetical protein